MLFPRTVGVTQLGALPEVGELISMERVMPETPSLSPLPGSRADETLRTIERLAAVAQQKGLAYDLTLSAFVSSGNVQFQHSGPPLLVQGEILVLEGQIVKNQVIVKEKAPNLVEQGKKQDLDKILKEQVQQDLDQILEEQREQDLDQALQMEVAVLPHTLSQHAI